MSKGVSPKWFYPRPGAHCIYAEYSVMRESFNRISLTTDGWWAIIVFWRIMKINKVISGAMTAAAHDARAKPIADCTEDVLFYYKKHRIMSGLCMFY